MPPWHSYAHHVIIWGPYGGHHFFFSAYHPVSLSLHQSFHTSTSRPISQRVSPRKSLLPHLFLCTVVGVQKALSGGLSPSLSHCQLFHPTMTVSYRMQTHMLLDLSWWSREPPTALYASAPGHDFSSCVHIMLCDFPGCTRHARARMSCVLSGLLLQGLSLVSQSLVLCWQLECFPVILGEVLHCFINVHSHDSVETLMMTVESNCLCVTCTGLVQ